MNYTVVIVFDECPKDRLVDKDYRSNNASSDEFIDMFIYVRRCMEELGLIGIVIGTNARLSDYVKFIAVNFSRAEKI